MRKSIFIFLTIIALTFIIHGTIEATTVTYDATNISGNSWQYDYTITNDTLFSLIDEFTVFFEYGFYDNITGNPVTDWDILTSNPQLILGIPQDGLYDAFALVISVQPGVTASGFKVSFEWLGADMPGSQYYEIVDSDTFEVIDSGQTSAAKTTVPEPTTFILVGLGLIALSGLQRRITCT